MYNHFVIVCHFARQSGNILKICALHASFSKFSKLSNSGIDEVATRTTTVYCFGPLCILINHKCHMSLRASVAAGLSKNIHLSKSTTGVLDVGTAAPTAAPS